MLDRPVHIFLTPRLGRQSASQMTTMQNHVTLQPAPEAALRLAETMRFLDNELIRIAVAVESAMGHCQCILTEGTGTGDRDVRRGVQHLYARMEGMREQVGHAMETTHRLLEHARAEAGDGSIARAPKVEP